MAVFESYSKFRDTTISCHQCEWIGHGADARVGETIGEGRMGLTEYLCPQCESYLAIAPRPSVGENHSTGTTEPG